MPKVKRDAVRAAVIHIEIAGASTELALQRSAEAKLEEAINLADALALEVVYTSNVRLQKPHPRALLGTGKIEEIGQMLEDEDVYLVIMNCRLTPTQQRNLEVAWKCKVIDRTGLILEIFGDRARTHAGRLQVELAALNYQASRLVRAWTHLERQRGGLGKTGGPGERQIELDRRIMRDRIIKIKAELEEVEKTRALHRKARLRSGLPVVALVGYTNAGKSTLFNALVGEQALAKDMLFATLDPLMRKMRLPGSGREIILSDTVGFISELPHELVQAFHATLEEVALADLLLHVHDASSPDAEMQQQDVTSVLKSIHAERIPVIHVLNKIDMTTAEDGLRANLEGVEVSALTGLGIADLQRDMESFFATREEEYTFTVPAGDGRRLAWLHANGDVLQMDFNEAAGTYEVTVRLQPEDSAIFKQMING